MPVLSREGVQFAAFVTGVTSSIFRVLEVRTSCGANLLDHAVVSIDLGDPRVQQYVQDLDLNTLSFQTPDAGRVNLQGAECAIAAIVGGQIIAVHWGKLTLVEIDIGARESITFVSRLEDVHFGVPLGFQRVLNPQTGNTQYSEHDVVFNPEIKKVIVPNKRLPISSLGLGLGYPIFIDPASFETRNASIFQDNNIVVLLGSNDRFLELSAGNWTLIDAVQYLCGECNGDEIFVLNPTLAELQAVLPDDRAILKNHLIRNGLYLPEALEHLLEPYGFTFRIDYLNNLTRKLVILQDGKPVPSVSDEKTVLLQRAGSKLDLTLTNADHVQLNYDVSMATNQVTALGDFTYLEATWELMPAWTADLDQLDEALLEKDAPEWDDHPEYRRVWRDWVLNEAGDYARAWGDQPASGAFTHMSDWFNEAFNGHPPIVPKRRSFHPMRTLGKDGQPLGDEGGCKVQWWNNLKEGGADWDDLDPEDAEFSCRILTDECGIRFTHTFPPGDIIDQGTKARLRITAVVRSDHRMSALAPKNINSVNPDTHERVLDVNTRFHAIRLHQESLYYSDVQNGKYIADVSDGFLGLQDFANRARDAWDQANCGGTIRLEGLDHLDYELGDLITSIQGRNVGLSLNKGPGSQARFPQIVGITRYMQEQKTLLTVNEFRETDALMASFIRKTKRLK